MHLLDCQGLKGLAEAAGGRAPAAASQTSHPQQGEHDHFGKQFGSFSPSHS